MKRLRKIISVAQVHTGQMNMLLNPFFEAESCVKNVGWNFDTRHDPNHSRCSENHLIT